MTDFKKGDICYTPDGVQCAFDHIHDGMAFVRKGFTVEQHDMNSGDVDSYIEFSDTLTVGRITDLTPKAPVQAISDEVTVLTARKKELQRDIAALQTDTRAVEKQRKLAIREAEIFMEEHPMFAEISDLIKGVEFFALESSTNTTTVPTVCDTKKNGLKVLTLVTTYNKGWKWLASPKRDTYGNPCENLYTLFRTEEELHAHVALLWVNVLAKYKDNPKRFETTSHPQRDKPNGTILDAWRKAWPHLKLPEWVTMGWSNNARYKQDEAIAAAERRVVELKAGAL